MSESTTLKQVSPLPTSKVMAGAAAGAVAMLIVWGVETWGTAHGQPIRVPGHIAGLLSTVLTFVVQYFTPPSSRDRVEVAE